MYFELWHIFTGIGVVAITFLFANIIAWIGEYYGQKNIIASVKKISSSGDFKKCSCDNINGKFGFRKNYCFKLYFEKF